MRHAPERRPRRYLDYITTDQDALKRDGRTRDAVERCLERICEAAFRLGDEAARLVPNQPWGDIRGMGNRLRHAYERLSLPVIWHAIQDELPALKADMRLALIAAQRTRQN